MSTRSNKRSIALSTRDGVKTRHPRGPDRQRGEAANPRIPNSASRGMHVLLERTVDLPVSIRRRHRGHRKYRPAHRAQHWCREKPLVPAELIFTAATANIARPIEALDVGIGREVDLPVSIRRRHRGRGRLRLWL
jgi:hypothetical protein